MLFAGRGPAIAHRGPAADMHGKITLGKN